MSPQLDVPAPVRALARQLEKAGFETWAVGGAVRDAIRGRRGENADWDLATRATPRQMRQIFDRTVPLGPRYGTLGVFGRDGVLYEITTFRRDVATDGRRATVAFAQTVEEDLARRDFTVNAMAWHPDRRELRDPHGGRRDLADGVLRAVGDPAERFREDYLRVLRGLRFAGALDLRVDANTWRGLLAGVPGLGRLSKERVREEFMRVLAGRRPSRALSLYQRSGALPAVLPEAVRTVNAPDPRHDTPGPSHIAGPEDVSGPLKADGLALVDAIRPHRPLLRLAAVLLLVLKPPASREAVASILRRLRFSKVHAEQVALAVAAGLEPSAELWGDPVERRRWTAEGGAAGVRDATRIWTAALRVESTSEARARTLRLLLQVRCDLHGRIPLSLRDLAVGGNDLVERGWPPGPRIGETLRGLLEAVWEDPSRNERSTLLALAGEAEP